MPPCRPDTPSLTRFVAALLLLAALAPALVASAAAADTATKPAANVAANPASNSPTDAPAEVLAIYEEGKKSYDAGDYTAARGKFLQAIKRQPDNPRWHYNLGLTLRQLDNFQGARQALLKSRQLDPAYKRDEIDQKLLSMGFDPQADSATLSPSGASNGGSGTGTADSDDEQAATVLWLVAGIFALVIAFIGGVFCLIRRAGKAGSDPIAQAKARKAGKAVHQSPPDVAAIHALKRRLDAAALQLVRVEHSLRLGENADLRSLLDHASRAESALRAHLDAALDGNTDAFRRAGKTVADLESASQRALALAKSLHGEVALAGQGERIGCYFCARPLANADYRQRVLIKRGASQAEVVACPPCAAAAASGQAPAVLTDEEGKRHWSELPGFDPYTARHATNGQTQRLPAWRFAPQRSFGELALLAGGAALAGGALTSAFRSGPANAANAAEPLLDLDAAAESGRAQEAARASAQRAAEQKSERSSLSDHS